MSVSILRLSSLLFLFLVLLLFNCPRTKFEAVIVRLCFYAKFLLGRFVIENFFDFIS